MEIVPSKKGKESEMQGLPIGYQAYIKRVGSVADMRVAPGSRDCKSDDYSSHLFFPGTFQTCGFILPF